MKMYNIIHKKNVLQRYRTKREAQRELDDRSSLCYMLRVKPSEAYSITKGKIKCNQTKWVQENMAHALNVILGMQTILTLMGIPTVLVATYINLQRK